MCVEPLAENSSGLTRVDVVGVEVDCSIFVKDGGLDGVYHGEFVQDLLSFRCGFGCGVNSMPCGVALVPKADPVS